MVLGGVIAPLGLVIVIIVGWYGAAHSPFLFQQVPYLISGLGLGLGLVFLGSFFYFAHWITELVKEGRTQSAAMIEAIARLEETVKQQAGADRLAGALEAAMSSGTGDGRSGGDRPRARWPTDPTASSSRASPPAARDS